MCLKKEISIRNYEKKILIWCECHTRCNTIVWELKIYIQLILFEVKLSSLVS